MVNQDLPHHSRRHTKEVSATFPVGSALSGKLQVGLVNQRRRLQSMNRSLALHVSMRDAAQLVIDQWGKTIERLSIALATSSPVTSCSETFIAASASHLINPNERPHFSTLEPGYEFSIEPGIG